MCMWAVGIPQEMANLGVCIPVGNENYSYVPFGHTTKRGNEPKELP